MAGGGWKGTGAVLLVLGGLIAALGLAGVIVGSMFMNDGTSGPFGNREKARDGAQTVVASLAVLVVGAVLLILGTVFVSIGSAAARREMVQTLAKAPAQTVAITAVPVALPAPSRVPVWAIPAAIVGVVLVVALLALGNSGNGASPLNIASANPSSDGERYQGHLQGAGPASAAPGASDAHEWTPKVAARLLSLSFHVKGSTVTGSAHLTIEAFDGQSWRTIQTMSDGEKSMTVSPAAKLRFTAALNEGANGPGVGSLDYEVVAQVDV